MTYALELQLRARGTALPIPTHFFEPLPRRIGCLAPRTLARLKEHIDAQSGLLTDDDGSLAAGRPFHFPLRSMLP